LIFELKAFGFKLHGFLLVLIFDSAHHLIALSLHLLLNSLLFLFVTLLDLLDFLEFLTLVKGGDLLYPMLVIMPLYDRLG
jgi:hypothetical protein